MDELLKQTTKKIFIASIAAGLLYAVAGVLIVLGILSSNLLAPGAYNAPYQPELIDQVFGASIFIMGFVMFDVGKCAYAGIYKGDSTRWFPIHDFVLIMVSFMGIICCAGKGAFGLGYLICLIVAVVFLVVALRAKFPIDLN